MAVAKFQLSELVIGHIALVDRPAVPGAAFTLVKSADAANEALALRAASGWLRDVRAIAGDIADIRATWRTLERSLARVPARHHQTMPDREPLFWGGRRPS